IGKSVKSCLCRHDKGYMRAQGTQAVSGVTWTRPHAAVRRAGLHKIRNGFMNVSRQFLLGMLALGLQARLASALEPGALSADNPPRLPPTVPAGPATCVAG